MAARIHLDDLLPDQCRELGLDRFHHNEWKQKHCPGHAMKVLASIAKLTRQQRFWVLQFTLELNAVRPQEYKP